MPNEDTSSYSVLRILVSNLYPLYSLQSISPKLTMNATSEQQSTEQFSKTVLIVQAVFHLALKMLAILGNGVICLSALKLRKPVSPYVQLCVSLAANDLWVSVIFTVDHVLRLGPLVSHGSPCLFRTLHITSATVSGAWHLFALAQYQFVGIFWPLKAKTRIHNRHMRQLFAVLWSVPLVIIFGRYLWDEGDGLRAPFCIAHFREHFSYRVFVTSLVLLPLTLTILMYVRIVVYLRTSYTIVDVHNAADHDSSSKLVHTAVVIVFSFFLSYGIHTIYSLLLMLKLLLNPFIYTLRMNCFREGLSIWRRGYSAKPPSLELTSLIRRNNLTPGTAL